MLSCDCEKYVELSRYFDGSSVGNLELFVLRCEMSCVKKAMNVWLTLGACMGAFLGRIIFVPMVLDASVSSGRMSKYLQVYLLLL